MGLIIQQNYPLGWIPTDDDINGRQEGLLRADNLYYDENGIIALGRGTDPVSSAFAASINSIYSRRLGGNLYRYVHHGTTVVEDANGAETFAQTVLTGGGSYGAAFASLWGHNLICSGNQKKRTTGGATVADLSIAAPGAPTLSVNAPATVAVDNKSGANYDNWVNIEGTLNAAAGVDYVQHTVDATTLRGIAQTPSNGVGLTIDSLTLSGGSLGTDDDLFKMNLRCSDTAKVTKVKIEFLLQTPQAASTTEDVTDYYLHEWVVKDNIPVEELETELTRKGVSLAENFRQGINVWNTLICKRSQFTKVGGTDDTISWANVKGIRVTYIGTETGVQVVFNDLIFQGGTTGPLTGWYRYLVVQVYENDNYIGKSPSGTESAEVQAINAGINVTPPALAANANKAWIYRTGGKLDNWYRVKDDWTSGAFNDTLSDEDALRQNVSLPVALYSGVPDNVIAIVGPIHDRVLYVTQKSIFLSDLNDPGRYNVNHELEIAGSSSEVICFATKVNEDTVYIGTTADIYALTGTLLEDPESGLIDGQLKGLGLHEHPPINASHAVDKSIIFYRANDGIRATAGSSTEVISINLDLLFKRTARHGINPPIALTSFGDTLNEMAISRGRLFYAANLDTTGRVLFIYDFVRQVWLYKEIPGNAYVTNLFCEEDGNLLGGGGADFILRSVDTGTKIDGATNQLFRLRTVYQHGGLPRNRKDAYTLKIIADTGNTSVNITLRAYNDSSSTVAYTTSSAFNGRTERAFPVYASLAAAKYFQLEIDGQVPTFKLYSWSVDFEPRPEQVASLRIKAVNLGTAKRKRFQALPFVIDTLGNNVNLTPYIDGVAQPGGTLNANGKRTKFHWFTGNVTGIDCEMLLEAATSGNVFELYEFAEKDAVYEILPLATQYMKITETNWGTAARKRFARLSIVVNPRGATLTLTPSRDGVADTPLVVIGGSEKVTINYLYAGDTIAVDVGMIITGTSEFEFYEMLKPEVLEVLPEPAPYLKTVAEDFGTLSRKRCNRISFIIDTRGVDTTVIPILDGVAQTANTYNTNRKQLVSYYFPDDVTFTQVQLEIDSTVPTAMFEYYGMLKPERLELLPEPVAFLRTPNNNFGVYARKRFNNVPIIIDTLGINVTATPVLDGVDGTAQVLNTSRKQTVPFYFSEDAVCVDLGYKFDAAGPFEFYDFLKPQRLEVLPERVKFLRIPNTNFGKPSKKRIRTIPLSIDTLGQEVVYTPMIDGVSLPTKIFNTNRKQTVFYYVTTDVFGIDIGGTLASHGNVSDFEFYGFETPEVVEVLPTGKLFDQIGPIEFNRNGKIRRVRLRMIAEDSSISYTIYAQDDILIQGMFQTTINKERVYELSLPKAIKPTVFRMELAAANFPFYRLPSDVLVDITGNGTEWKTIRV